MFREGTDFSVWTEAGENGARPLTTSPLWHELHILLSAKESAPDRRLEDLFELFFENYLDKTGDDELLEVIAPFFAFRLWSWPAQLVPLLSDDVRRALFNFLRNVLASKRFNFRDVNSYLD